MSNMGDQFKDELLGNNFASPTGQLYVALFDADPADDGSGATEISGLGYNRIPVTFTAPSGFETHNNALLPFPLAQADWLAVGAWGLFADLYAGQLKMHGPLYTPLTIYEDDTVKIPTPTLSISFPLT